MALRILTGLLLLGFMLSPQADVTFSGFASVGAGKVISKKDDVFLSDYATVAQYDNDVSFSPDTTYGLQAMGRIDDKLSIASQIVGRGADEMNAGVEWAYITYELSPSLSMQVGRKRLPLYFYSDFYDVGYSYYWIRPPADNYTWQIFNYNGASLTYKTRMGDWGIKGDIYGGREDSRNNKLLSEFFFGETTNETWKSMLGAVLTVSGEMLEVRLNYLQGLNDRDFPDAGSTSTPFENYRFHNYGMSVNLDTGSLIVLTEYNMRRRHLDPAITTWLASVGYRIGSLTPHVTYSKFSQEKLAGVETENHNTSIVGVRYDFHPSAAAKLQWDKVQDEGGPGWGVAGDSETISAAIDMIF